MDILKLEKILSGEKKISKKEKDLIIKFDDYIPMYDIYSNNIYLIGKNDLYNKMMYKHYRFIDPRLYKWLNNKFQKINKKNDIKQDEIKNKIKLKEILNFLKNYNIKKLYQKSIETIYNFSPEIGLDITICKKKSFIPYFSHLTPYYSKDELINMGMNMNKIKMINKEVLVDPDIHYKICKKISKNDINSKNIIKNCLHIRNTYSKYLVKYYSLYGSFFINKILRSIFDKSGNLKNEKINDPQIITFAKLLTNTIVNSPPLDKEYIVYRFITDDSYLKKIKIGDVFIETGIMSTTRDPFYSNNSNDSFGFILMKIKLPKGLKGIALNIETYSFFPYEEEIILPPLSKLKLISKNENFDYFHIDKNFEKKIKKKYEFEYIGLNSKINIPKKLIINTEELEVNFLQIELEGNDYIEKSNYFIQKYTNQLKNFYIKINNIKYRVNTIWYDSTGPYKKFYYFETEFGLSFVIYDNIGRVLLMIEINKEISINYFMRWNESNDGTEKIDGENLIHIISTIAHAFNINKIFIHFNYCSYYYFINNYKDNNQINVIDCFNFNFDFYNYIKFNKKRFIGIPGLSSQFSYFQLDKLKKIKCSDIDTKNKVIINLIKSKFKNKTCTDLYLYINEHYFYLLDNLIESINYFFVKNDNPFENMLYILEPYKYLFDRKLIKQIPNIGKNYKIKEDIINNIDYKNIFKSRFRSTY
jgi:hypothetical protein